MIADSTGTGWFSANVAAGLGFAAGCWAIVSPDDKSAINAKDANQMFLRLIGPPEF